MSRRSQKNNSFFILVILLLGCFLLSGNSQAAVRKEFNYQGKLTDVNGLAVADGAYDVTFKIYTQAGGGTAAWTESWTSAALFTDAGTTVEINGCAAGINKISYTSNTNESSLVAGQTLWNTTKKQSAVIESVLASSNYICVYSPASAWANGDTVTNRVYVKNGIFSVMVGSVATLTLPDFTGSAYYLGVTVGSDSEMIPRKKIGSVPQAWNANNLSGDGIIDIDNTSVAHDAGNIYYDPASGNYNALSVTYGAAGGTGTALTVTQSGTGAIVSLANTAPATADAFALTNLGSGKSFIVNDEAADATPFVIDASGNVGIGTTAPTAKIDIQSLAVNDLPAYSAEFLLSTDWTSTDWTGDFATGWTHTTGNTTALSQSKSAVNATKYQIAYAITGRTAGSFTISFGGQSSSEITATGAWGPTTSSTASLTIAPTSDFNGTIVISIKSLTAVSTPILTLKSSDGTARIEMRANTAMGNTFIGNDSGRYNTTGSHNTANGYGSLFFNTTGYDNTAIGLHSLYSNTTGDSNTAIGLNSLYSNTTGYNNTAIGLNSLYSNTTGDSNTAIGLNSLLSNATGSHNTANGYGSLFFNTTGYNNTAIGLHSLYSNTTGYSNSALGATAGRFIADGSTANQTSNTSLYLGANTKAKADNDANEIVIGYDAVGLGSNTVILGNNSIATTVLRGTVGIGTESPDLSYKLDVNGSIHGAGYYSIDGSAGISTTINVRDQYNTSNCTITVKNGLITATTCP